MSRASSRSSPSRSRVGTGLLSAVASLLLYAASLGPVAALSSRGIISDRTFERVYGTIYYPIWLIEMRTDLLEHPVGQLYVRYVWWWME